MKNHHLFNDQTASGTLGQISVSNSFHNQTEPIGKRGSVNDEKNNMQKWRVTSIIA